MFEKVRPGEVSRAQINYIEMNNDQHLKAGDWVKEKNGTQGMTVVAHVQDSRTSEPTGEVKCRYKNSVGETVESNFWEVDLVKL